MKRRKVALRRSKKGIKRFRNLLRGVIGETLKRITLLESLKNECFSQKKVTCCLKYS